MSAPHVPLSELPAGRAGTIVALRLRGPLRRRLLALGLVSGELVTVTRVAPLGDPLELEVKGYRLALRKEEAGQIVVEPRG